MESHKEKGYIRLFSIEEDETVSQWLEGFFPEDVIASTGMTSCNVNNDRTYIVNARRDEASPSIFSARLGVQ